MKNVLLTLLFAAAAVVLSAQTPFQSFSSRPHGLTGQQASAHNPWIGAKLSYTFDDAVDLSDNFLLNGRLLYNLSAAEAKWQFPIISNVSLSLNGNDGIGDALLNDRGITAGLYPYTILSQNETSTWVIHGAGVYKILPNTNAESSLQQVKLLAGVEYAHVLSPGGLPTTISLTPAYSFNNLENPNFFSLEATGVIPVASGMGLLLEYTVPFGSDKKSVFKAGIILHGQL